MRFPVFDDAREASLRTAFSHNAVDRQAETRADDAAERALEEAGARLLLFGRGRIALAIPESGPAEAFFGVDEAARIEARLADAVLLGREADRPLLAVSFDADPDTLPDGLKALDYRSVYRQQLVDDAALGALAQGAALLAWHENHRHCGRCGGATQMRAGGYKRYCPACAREHFPRTDPVVIMLVIDGDRCLLGRSPHFAPGMVSCLAGFVEPGETIEAAVRREVREESDVRVDSVAYHASQPWPFPHSLMIGCYARAASTAVTVDRNELEDCRWFERAEVRRMLAGDHAGGATVPPAGAIANILIRDWALRD